jgi:hypothetical protein
VTNDQRKAFITAFRQQVLARNGVTWFPHQAEWSLASEGWTLTDEPALAGDKFIEVIVPYDLKHLADSFRPSTKPMVVDGIEMMKVKRKIVPRGQIARFLTLLAAYKGGKSFSMGLWATGFAGLKDANVQFIGLEYGTSEHEYNYLCDALLSEKGMNMKWDSYTNDKRGGRMRLKLRSGCEYEVKSWNQKESLKGAKIDCYLYTEAYQLPGLQCFTSVSQNLRQRKGFAVFATTPDRPWVGVLHDQGHGKDPDWHCVCGIAAEANPFTFDQQAKDRDDPDKHGLMTRERFEIAWRGRLGSFVGRVYGYGRGECQFSRATHPQLFAPEPERHPDP